MVTFRNDVVHCYVWWNFAMTVYQPVDLLAVSPLRYLASLQHGCELAPQYSIPSRD
jgi:hypothetical protein